MTATAHTTHGTAGPGDLAEQSERPLVLTAPGQTPPGVDERAWDLWVARMLPGPLLGLVGCGLPAQPVEIEKGIA